MNRLKLTMLAAVLCLGGCATTQYLPAKPEEKVKAQANVVKTCDPVPAAPARGANFGNVYGAYDDLVGLYGECALRDRAKLDFIRSQGH
jgi:hypothetical protein